MVPAFLLAQEVWLEVLFVGFWQPHFDQPSICLSFFHCSFITFLGVCWFLAVFDSEGIMVLSLISFPSLRFPPLILGGWVRICLVIVVGGPFGVFRFHLVVSFGSVQVCNLT